MQIDYLSFSEIPSRAANSVHVMKMARSFSAAGHRVRLFAYGNSAVDEFAYYGVPRTFEIVKSPRPWFRGGGLILAQRAARLVRSEPVPDLIYGRHLASLLAVSGLGHPLVYESHSPPKNSLRALAESWLFRAPGFVRLVVITEALRKEYLSRFPSLSETQIVTAHDGADLPGVQQPGTNFPWPGRRGALQCGYVGHLYVGRGIEVIVALARRLRHVDFHIAGGTKEDIAALVGRGVPPNLHMHGFIPHGMLGQMFEHFDVVLAPYHPTGVTVAGGSGDTSKWMSPLKLFEYMAHSKAIVCSDVPVLREVLQDKVTAILVSPTDIAEWEAAVRALEVDPERRHSLGDEARKMLEARYTWDIRARRVLAGLSLDVE